MAELQVPGVTFSLEDAELRKVKGKKIAKVTLEAVIMDDDVWEAVQDKLDGMKIYSVEDFQEQIIDLMKDDNEKLDGQVGSLQERLQEAHEHMKQQASFDAQTVEELRRENEALRQRVDRLESMERELQDLART